MLARRIRIDMFRAKRVAEHTLSEETRMTVSVSTARPIARRTDRLFYGGMAALILAIVFLGFMRTFYMPSTFGRAAPAGLRVVHGTAFTAWVVLFAVQTSLITAGRRNVHRKLGWLGTTLAATMVVLGLTLAIDAARQGNAPLGLSPLSFFIIPFTDMVVFAPLVAAAVYFRGSPETHKRLMLIATLSLLGAPLARITGTPGAGGPPVFFGIPDLLILGGAIYDRLSRGRVHPAYKWAGGAVVASQVARLALARTPIWLALAHAITGI
jgi:hypothetical protein